MQPTACTITLTRRGRFVVEQTRDDSCQCGEQGLREFYYTVKFCSCESALDDKGFLVDQLVVNEAIVNHFKNIDVLPSCERMAITVAQVVADLCTRGLKWVEASVGGKEFAWMEARMEFNSKEVA